MGTYDSVLDLNLGHLSGIEDPAINTALLDIHNAIEIIALNLAGSSASPTPSLLARVIVLEQQFNSLVTVSANHVISNNIGTILVNASANAVRVILPTAIGNAGKTYTIKVIATGFISDVATSGAETIDGSTDNFILSLHESVTLQSDGANWWIK